MKKCTMNQSFKNEIFWSHQGKRIDWFKPYTKIKDVLIVKIKLKLNGTSMVQQMYLIIA